MNQLNTIIVEGNVTRNAELSEPVPGFTVCKFPIAINRYYKDANGEGKEEVSYLDVEVYGEDAETAEKSCSKGRGVRVVGRIKQSRWETEDGKKFSRIFIVAEHVEYKPLKNEFFKNKGNSPAQMKSSESAPLEEEAYEEAASF